MNMKKLSTLITNPTLFTPGTDLMWTEPHIAKQLLQVHINPDLELASRRKETIDITVEWILRQRGKSSAKILDLGCGPGLYCSRYAAAGHDVTGVDFSANSIAYAKEQAAEKGLSVEYLVGNYCEMELPEEQYDLITLIYTDLGVLSPEDQQRVLSNVHRWLKPGGVFIFDLLSEDAFERAAVPKSWEVSEGGFWREGAYMALSETISYEEEKVVLSQHVVFDEAEEPAVYRFWTQYFSFEKIEALVESAGLNFLKSEGEVIPESDFHKSSDVLFTVVQK